MDQFINGIDQFSSLYWNLCGKKHLSFFLWSQITVNYTFSGFCKNNLARTVKYNMEIPTVYTNRLQTMGDKSNWDTFRKWHFDIQALVLFYLHIALILRYPWPPNAMLCRCCLRNRKSTLFWGKGGIFYSKLSQHFCCWILAQWLRKNKLITWWFLTFLYNDFLVFVCWCWFLSILLLTL